MSLRVHIGRIPLTPAVHNDLDDWCRIIVALCSRPTHMLEVVPPDPTTLGVHNACSNSIGGVFQGPNVIPFVCCWRFPEDITARLVSWDNLEGDRDINEFKIAGHYAQAALFFPRMTPLAASVFGCDNFTTILWVKRGSISCQSPATAFLRSCALLLREHQILGRVGFLPGKMNGMADATWRLWKLSGTDFLTYFFHHFPQDKYWHICQPPPAMMHHISTVLRAL